MIIQPRLVEFVGLPGAGKTTIAQRVIQELTDSGHRCFGLSRLDTPEGLQKEAGGFYDKLRSAGYCALSCIVHRKIAKDALLYGVHVEPFNIISLRRVFRFMVRLKSVTKLANGSYDMVILDQGIMQDIWSIAASGHPPSDDTYLERLINSILDRLSLLVVVIDIDVEKAIQRIARRQTMRSRFDRMPVNQAEALLNRHKDVFTQIVKVVRRCKRAECLSVSGDLPVDQNVEAIASFLERGSRKWALQGRSLNE